MKILLSYSKKHFVPNSHTSSHSAGVLASALYEVCKRIGDTTYIDWNEDIKNEEYDIFIGLPRSFERIVKSNKFGITFCFPAIAEPSFTREILRKEADRLGCKVSDAFSPDGIYLADALLVVGSNFVFDKYLAKHKRVYRFDYGMPGFKFQIKQKAKSGMTTFIHVATTLGLRKGFWHVINDFRNAALYRSKLICVGRIQNERFWADFASSVKDQNIEIHGFTDSASDVYKKLLYEADFMVYPSLSEGQPGTVLEAMAAGVIPLLSTEAGIDYFPLGIYKRGNATELLMKAEDMNEWTYHLEQERLKGLVERKFNIEAFKDSVERVIRGIISEKL